MTPWMLPNRESGPQNQPMAKVAVSVTAGLSLSSGGIDRKSFIFVSPSACPLKWTAAGMPTAAAAMTIIVIILNAFIHFSPFRQIPFYLHARGTGAPPDTTFLTREQGPRPTTRRLLTYQYQYLRIRTTYTYCAGPNRSRLAQLPAASETPAVRPVLPGTAGK